MGRQTYRDESNRKHRPHNEHDVDDKFGKGTQTRNWNKNLKRYKDVYNVDDTKLKHVEESEKKRVNPNHTQRSPAEGSKNEQTSAIINRPSNDLDKSRPKD